MSRVTNWSVVGWQRYAKEEPSRERGRLALRDGNGKVEQFEVLELPDQAWRDRNLRDGVEIHDSRRGITYRATVDERGDLDHLEVVLDGFIDDRALKRLSSVPVERIRREANLHLIAEREAGPGVFVFTPEGGVKDDDRDGSPYKPPSAQDLADLFAEHPNWGRQEVAAHYAAHYGGEKRLRAVDRWLREARKDPLVGHLIPAATRDPKPKYPRKTTTKKEQK